MTAKTQISAFVSRETKSRLDRFVRGKGLSQAFVIEQALLHHLAALSELPPDAIVPSRLVLTPASAARVLEMIAARPRPTAAMRELFDGD